MAHMGRASIKATQISTESVAVCRSRVRRRSGPQDAALLLVRRHSEHGQPHGVEWHTWVPEFHMHGQDMWVPRMSGYLSSIYIYIWPGCVSTAHVRVPEFHIYIYGQDMWVPHMFGYLSSIYIYIYGQDMWVPHMFGYLSSICMARICEYRTYPGTWVPYTWPEYVSELLVPRPTPNIFAATPHGWRLSIHQEPEDDPYSIHEAACI
jgi:hypothetical protein